MAEKLLSQVTLTSTTQNVTHTNKNLFQILNSTFDDLNLIQLVEFPTWQRIINNVKKESILDHIYVQDPTIIENITHKIPLIGDHKLIMFEIVFKPEKITLGLERKHDLILTLFLHC